MRILCATIRGMALRLVSDVMCGDRIAWAANERLHPSAASSKNNERPRVSRSVSQRTEPVKQNLEPVLLLDFVQAISKLLGTPW